jgi:hypothetical protein
MPREAASSFPLPFSLHLNIKNLKSFVRLVTKLFLCIGQSPYTTRKERFRQQVLQIREIYALRKIGLICLIC